MAVPVREELLAHWANWSAPAPRGDALCRAGPRKAGGAGAAPALGAQLLEEPTQALDEAGKGCVAAWLAALRWPGQLQRVAGRLSLPLLAARLERARERLAAQRLPRDARRACVRTSGGSMA
jgi:exodeoxyribonuclease VII large subunit